MTRRTSLCGFLAVLLVVAGCGPKGETTQQSKEEQPDYVTVQHILVGFQGSVPDKDIARTQEEAGQLANDVYSRAKNGEDFDALVREYTDDDYPGVYELANFDAKPDPNMQIYARKSMMQSFGDVGFSLGVGGIGLAVYDKDKCKYGWHVIKRLE